MQYSLGKTDCKHEQVGAHHTLTSIKHNACIACCAFLGKEKREKLQLNYVLPKSRSLVPSRQEVRIKIHPSK